jgi:5-methylcytosine-specific restriction endonuclease McrA
MNGLPYYKAYPRDFMEGTLGMPFEMKAAYRLLLDLIYIHGGTLRDDPRYISGMLGCTIIKWKSLRGFLVSDGKLEVNTCHLSAPLAARWMEQSRRDDTRPAIPLAVRSEVIERDGMCCQYCGDTEGPFHLDHVFPWSRGGTHTADNLTVSCAPCNWSKGSKTVEEWRPIQ